MQKQKLGISLKREYPVPAEDVVKIIADSGFDAVSPIYAKGEILDPILKSAKDCGLYLQSLHAPFGKAASFWRENEDTARYEESLRRCLQICTEHGIPTLVMHAWIGMEYTFENAALDFSRFDRLVDLAEKQGVCIAFENTEGEEYLDALMQHFIGCDTVGFCWDSGHENCYNYNRDWLKDYGPRLAMTHLNDNCGMKYLEGKRTPMDDLHLLPYDGEINWNDAVARLKTAKKQEYLNFELAMVSRPGQHECDKYEQMSLPRYFAEAYERADRIAALYVK